MFSDAYNPVFVFKTQKVFTFCNKYRFSLLVGVLVLTCLAAAIYPSIVNAMQPVSPFTIGILAALYASWFNLIAFFTGIVPGITFAKKQIDKDLSHFTPMSYETLINGYVLGGVFYSCLFIVVLGFPVSLIYVVLTGDLISVFVTAISAVAYAILVNLFVMSFLVGVQNMTQLIVTGFLIYMLYYSILSLCYSLGVLPVIIYHLYQMTPMGSFDMPISVYVYWWIALPCFAFAAYRLTLYNYRKIGTQFSKQASLIGLYILLLLALTALSLLLFALLGSIPFVMFEQPALIP